jgi:hypothetical protein
MVTLSNREERFLCTLFTFVGWARNSLPTPWIGKITIKLQLPGKSCLIFKFYLTITIVASIQVNHHHLCPSNNNVVQQHYTIYKTWIIMVKWRNTIITYITNMQLFVSKHSNHVLSIWFIHSHMLQVSHFLCHTIC